MGKKKSHTCKVDGRKFKTAAALQQHERDSHHGGSGSSAGSGRNRTTRGPGRQRRLQHLASPQGGDERAALESLLVGEFGCSDEGAKYVGVVAHPSGSSGRDFSGVPDSTSGATITFEVRSSSYIKPKPKDGTRITQWEVQIFTCPSFVYSYVRRVTTYYADGTSVTEYAFQNDEEATISTAFSECRPCARGLTCHLVANSTNNQGTVTAAQFAAELNAEPESGGKLEASVNMGDVTDIVRRCPSAIVHEACKGVAFSAKLLEPTFRFSPLQQVETTYKFKYSTEETIVSQVEHPDYENTFMTCYASFISLSPEATVQVSATVLFEGRSSTASGLVAAMATPSPILDRASLDAAIIISQVTPDAYPASANDLGSMLKSAWGALITYGRPVISAYAKSGLPYSQVAATVDRGIGYAQQIFAGTPGVAPADPMAVSPFSMVKASRRMRRPVRY